MSLESFKNLYNWVQFIKKHRIKPYKGIIVSNKNDFNKKEVNKEEAEEIA